VGLDYLPQQLSGPSKTSEPKNSTSAVPHFPVEYQNHVLLVHGPHLHFSLDFTRPRHHQARGGFYGYFEISVNNISRFLQIMSTEKEVSATQDSQQSSVLLARDHLDKSIIHYFLPVYSQANFLIVERGTAQKLFVPMENLDVLEFPKPTKRHKLRHQHR
jgi:hypothetical protein